MIKKFKSFEGSDTKDLLNKMRKLSDVKSEVKPTDLKLKSVEYIYLKFINWFISENGIKSIEEFNKKNELDTVKFYLFPFFIFAADSGKRDKILEIFKFSATDIGIVDISIDDNMLNKSNLFEFYLYDVEVIGEKFNFENELIIKEKDYFKDIEEYIPIFDASIKILYNKNSKFINLEKNTLIFYSQRHNSWQCFYGPEFVTSSGG